MSLDRSEQARTGEELRRHADASGLSRADLARWVGLDEPGLERVLAMQGADPATVWLVRDVLDQAVRERGVDAGGWSVLTDAARNQATHWFDLRPVPPRP